MPLGAPNRRLIDRFWPWALLLFVLVLVMGVLVPAPLRSAGRDVATLLGVLFLALPALRLNEQGRRIERVRKLRLRIDAIDEQLKAATSVPPAVRERQTTTLAARRADLEHALGDLMRRKGSWTPKVHASLYLGYVCLLAAALARTAEHLR